MGKPELEYIKIPEEARDLLERRGFAMRALQKEDPEWFKENMEELVFSLVQLQRKLLGGVVEEIREKSEGNSVVVLTGLPRGEENGLLFSSTISPVLWPDMAGPEDLETKPYIIDPTLFGQYDVRAMGRFGISECFSDGGQKERHVDTIGKNFYKDGNAAIVAQSLLTIQPGKSVFGFCGGNPYSDLIGLVPPPNSLLIFKGLLHEKYIPARGEGVYPSQTFSPERDFAPDQQANTTETDVRKRIAYGFFYREYEEKDYLGNEDKREEVNQALEQQEKLFPNPKVKIETFALTDEMRDRLERRCFAMDMLQEREHLSWFKKHQRSIAGSFVKLIREEMGEMVAQIKACKEDEIPLLLANLPRGEKSGLFFTSVLGEVMEMPRKSYDDPESGLWEGAEEELAYFASENFYTTQNVLEEDSYIFGDVEGMGAKEFEEIHLDDTINKALLTIQPGKAIFGFVYVIGQGAISEEENQEIDALLEQGKFVEELNPKVTVIMPPANSVMIFGNYNEGRMEHFRYSPERPKGMSVAQITDPERDVAPWKTKNETENDLDTRIAYALEFKGKPSCESPDVEKVEEKLTEMERGFDEAMKRATLLRKNSGVNPGGKGGAAR